MVKTLLENYHLLRSSTDLVLREYLIDLNDALNKLSPDDLRLIQLAYIVPVKNPRIKSRQYRESRQGKIRTNDEMIQFDPSLNAGSIRERLNAILDKLELEMVQSEDKI